jgi:hypothetical protein
LARRRGHERGCGAPVSGQIGVASTVEKCEATGLPSRFIGSVMLKIESIATTFCYDDFSGKSRLPLSPDRAARRRHRHLHND